MALCVTSFNAIGTRMTSSKNHSSQYISHIESMQNTLLGLLALVLGFTFSLALSRFENRSEAAAMEANSMGDVLALAQLLPEATRESMAAGVKRYIELRIEAGEYLVDSPERQSLLAATQVIQHEMWALAYEAATQDSTARIELFINAMVEMFDAFEARDAQLHRQVPQPVLWLLFITFLFSAGIIGYTAGLSRQRPSLAAGAFVLLILGLMVIIIDLDHPRNGLIVVDQSVFDNVHAAAKSL
jgi:hypothetical protein